MATLSKHQNDFLYIVATHAVRCSQESKIPPSVKIAQAILESDWGRSELARKANNLYGIKAKEWAGPRYRKLTSEYIGGRRVEIFAEFRKYESWVKCIEDHDKFLQRPVYRAAERFKGDAIQYAQAIARCGYATDPFYAVKLAGIIDKYNLRKYDEQVKD